jgi:hypothetical protein
MMALCNTKITRSAGANFKPATREATFPPLHIFVLLAISDINVTTTPLQTIPTTFELNEVLAPKGDKGKVLITAPTFVNVELIATVAVSSSTFHTPKLFPP